MRHWWLPFMLLAGALHAQSAPETGHWRGSARFFETNTRQALGALPVELRFDTDGRLQGRIGDGAFAATAPEPGRGPPRVYRLLLDAPASARDPRARRHVVVLVMPSPPGTLDADFHLKSRFALDLRMNVGHLDVAPLAGPP